MIDTKQVFAVCDDIQGRHADGNEFDRGMRTAAKHIARAISALATHPKPAAQRDCPDCPQNDQCCIPPGAPKPAAHPPWCSGGCCEPAAHEGERDPIAEGLQRLDATLAECGAKPVKEWSRYDTLLHMASRDDPYDLGRLHEAPQPPIKAVQEVSPKLLEALEAAKSGLEWYRDRYPEAVDGSDDEMDAQIDAAILALRSGASAQPADKDTARLDYLQRRGATVEIIPVGRGGWSFRIGGRYATTNVGLREAIDEAMRKATAAQPAEGGANGR